MSSIRPAHVLAAIFAATFAFVWWLAGDRLVFLNDEGIFLSHAARIAGGEALYTDLFNITGPASYWSIAVAFKIAGVSLAAAHVILALQIALITTAIYFITRELADTAAAALAAVIFLAINSADPAMMANNHRWDADTYAILGIVAIWRSRPVLGGFLLALSVWSTPIFAITALTVLAAAYLIRQSPWRVIAGGAAGAATGILLLLATGSLRAFVDNLFWVKSNYSGVNRMPYGSVIGGYPALFEGSSSAFEYAFRGLIVAGLTIPVWLPPLCGILVLTKRDRQLVYFYICALSMIACVSPRFDLGHLAFAVPLFYPIAASFLQKARWVVLPVGAIAGLFLFSTILQRGATVPVDTPIGRIRTEPETAEIVRFLTTNIKPGERLFVYPYPPIAYFLTRGQNVSRYNVLHPGMFTIADEKRATEDMLRLSPSKVLFMDIPPKDFLRIWPASDPNQLELRYIHNFVTSNYQSTAQFRNLHIYTPTVRASSSPQ